MSSSSLVPSLANRVIFVTGSNGFVGRSLLHRLVTKESIKEVRALVRSKEAADIVTKLGATPVMGSLESAADLEVAMKGCDVVFHLAAHVALTGEWHVFESVTVKGTENVLQAAQAAKVQKLVHCSTAAVLVGSNSRPIVNATEDWSIPVASTLYPYSKSKALAEIAVKEAHQPGKFETVSIRPQFIWGKGDTVLLPTLTEKSKKGELVWFSGGNYLTSTCHVAFTRSLSSLTNPSFFPLTAKV